MAELEFIMEAPEHGRVVAFPSKSFVIGSAESCQLRFQTQLIGAEHAEIVKDMRGQWWVRDLLGTGAVAVNDAPVLDERLSPGDRLRVADIVLRVQDSGVNQHARTRSGDSVPVAPPPSKELAIETVIDSRYKIVKRIATGGMGQVYQAVHVELGKPLALKVMLPELSQDQEFVARFKREAIASSRIGQQNIIDISDFGRTPDGRFYFVMEFVDGKTLVRYRREGPFQFARVVHVGLQIARALAAAHSVNIVHRDLKPENVMLLQRPGQPDFVKVLDFGIAKVVNGAQTAAYTAIGTVVGTPQYMAPEQARGLPVDVRSDVYSLGLILHELIRGKPTFDGDSQVELMGKQVHEPAPPLVSPFGIVPRALEQIVMQMLAKEPSQRPASMEAVVNALEAVASTPTPTARTEPLSPVVAKSKAKTELLTNVAPLTPVPTRVQPATAVGQSAVDLAAIRPSRTPLIIAGLVLVVGALGVALWATRELQAAPKPVVTAPPAPVPVVEPAPPPASVVKIALETDPERAEVYEDDVLLGSTPLTLSRPLGTLASLRFEQRDYTPVSRKVRFESDTTVSIVLEKAKPAMKKPPPRPERTADDSELKDSPF
ncbi:MAG: hypothetical protein DI536_02830 [Archangium gephyra]|uniref:non-specific serine/threonine protein kinase n=1 Tax=Archangium gephyra TaxID=48 RepID=A0A2W5TTF6_9BACT|nr:MAG: hypothetical protein DI536_02830 [Archangium gephyra]